FYVEREKYFSARSTLSRKIASHGGTAAGDRFARVKAQPGIDLTRTHKKGTWSITNDLGTVLRALHECEA
ncbi:MAG: hypothetical protein QN141_13170, partial [Armatimonadota bacterium]|nr:hypothetical protein [Armatimonadota bacterium]